jgi:hypothetical protein
MGVLVFRKSKTPIDIYIGQYIYGSAAEAVDSLSNFHSSGGQ